VGPRASLDRCGKSRPDWDSIPRLSSPQPIAIPTELPSPHIYYVPPFYILLSDLILHMPTSALGEGVWSAPCPGHFTPWKDPVPIVQEAGWSPVLVWMRAKNLAPIRIRSPDRLACSQSLYRLSYPAHHSSK
jgi:hypothetical protein